MKTIFILFLIILVCFTHFAHTNILAQSISGVIINDRAKYLSNQKNRINNENKLVDLSIGKKRPDLIITDFNIISYDNIRMSYEYTVKNIGTIPVNFGGTSRIPNIRSAVSIQAFFSKDNIFNNNGDVAAGGTIFTSSRFYLFPGEEISDSFTIGYQLPLDPSVTPFLIAKIDWWGVVNELDESNNTKAILIEPGLITSTNDDIIALFSTDIKSGLPPLEVQFKDISLGNINSWKWSFGDGSFSSKQNPVHEYISEEGFTVSLTVSGSEGNSTITREDFIFTRDCAPSLQSIVIDNSQAIDLIEGTVTNEVVEMQKKVEIEIKNNLDIWLGILEITSSVDENDLKPNASSNISSTFSKNFIIPPCDKDEAILCIDQPHSTWIANFCSEGTVEVLSGLTPLSISINLISHLIEFDLNDIEIVIRIALELETSIPDFHEAVNCFFTLNENSIDCAKSAINELIEGQQQLDLLVQTFLDAEMEITRSKVEEWSSELDLMNDDINLIIEAGSNFYIKIIDGNGL